MDTRTSGLSGLDDAIVIVTGASSGIGRASAERFATEGATVVVADVDAEGGQETVDRIEETGGEALFIDVDVSDDTAVEAMVEETVETYGGLDAVHNNAGIEVEYASTADQTLDNWNRAIDVNLTGVWQCMRHEIPAMLADDGGQIVNTSSIGGMSAFGSAPYVGSKHGVIGLTRTAAVEYADRGIRVNAVCPGVVETPLIHEGAAAEVPEALEQVVASQPIGRMAAPEEVANAAVWLCSAESSFVTGHPLAVDGGMMAQ